VELERGLGRVRPGLEGLEVGLGDVAHRAGAVEADDGDDAVDGLGDVDRVLAVLLPVQEVLASEGPAFVPGDDVVGVALLKPVLRFLSARVLIHGFFDAS